MKVIAINSSIRKKKGITELILDPFIKGMESAGAEIETFYSFEMNIKPCQCEFDCWLKTLGKCWIDDDMKMLAVIKIGVLQ